MSGIDDARAIADKLKAEKEEKEAKDLQAKEEVKNSLAEIRANSNLAKLYNDNADLGADNLGGSLPMLKVHTQGKSSTNELSNGTEPNDGYFFYKPTQEQFKEVEVHVLTISKGYKSEGLQNKKDVFNQILGGVIMDDGQLKPFIMYFTGKKLQNLWNFGKEASPYTHAKPVSIPMFALTVKLSTHSEKNEFGKSWIVDFEIVKEESGAPRLVIDEGLFMALKDSVGTVQDMINKLIEAKANETVEAVEEEVINGEGPEVDPESIPF